ncbi:hypothetical protein D3C76_1375440 [compost metagenome]
MDNERSFGSALATSVKVLAESIARLFRWVITSPGRRPIIAAGPSWTSLITTPLVMSRDLRCSAVRSATVTPMRLLLRSAPCPSMAATSASSSGRLPTAMLRVLREPSRITSMEALSPGFMLPTRCGRSADSLMLWPFRLRMTSPTCRPPLAAGPPSTS